MKTIYLSLAILSLISCVSKKKYTSLSNKYFKLSKEHEQMVNYHDKINEAYTKENLEKKYLEIDIEKLKQKNDKLNNSLPVIKFYNPKYDFGTIKMRSSNKHKFRFINEGNSPLVITGVDVDCSCTVPKYPDYGIMPGEEGVITLDFTPSIPTGVQRKKIGILCNTESGKVELSIKAVVLNP